MVGGFILPIYFISKRRIPDLVHPINLILFFLFKDSTVTRVMLFFLNYQYVVNILPMIEQIRIRLVEYLTSTKVISLVIE